MLTPISREMFGDVGATGTANHIRPPPGGRPPHREVCSVDSTMILLIVVVVLLLIALGIAGVMLSRKRRSEQLQEHYGPENERSVREKGDRRAAEAELTGRERRHEELDIRA